jgi:hypothetical protein
MLWIEHFTKELIMKNGCRSKNLKKDMKEFFVTHKGLFDVQKESRAKKLVKDMREFFAAHKELFPATRIVIHS